MAYRTISTELALIATNTIPLGLKVKQIAAIERVKETREFEGHQLQPVES